MNVNGKKCRITLESPGVYVLSQGEQEITRGPSPRALCNEALYSGAAEVRWDFDLAVWEPTMPRVKV